MTFKASFREIENGFLVDLNPKPLEYEEAYAPTFEEAIAAIVASYRQWHPSIPPATPLRVPEKAPKKPLLEEPSEGAIRYTKICGLIAKDYSEFLEHFTINFPRQDIQAAMEAAYCKVVEKKVVFVGG